MGLDPNEEARYVEKIVALHMRPLMLIQPTQEWPPTQKAIAHLTRDLGPVAPEVFALCLADIRASRPTPEEAAGDLERLKELIGLWKRQKDGELKESSSPPPLITGKDLQALGIPAGKVYSQILKEVKELEIQGVIKNRGMALEWLENHLAEMKRVI